MVAPLFILAGYLAAATRYCPVAILVDATHAWVYGWMLLHRGGVVRLPHPMAIADGGVTAVLQQMAGGSGGMWPGLLLTSSFVSAASTAPPRGASLHWCSLHKACCEGHAHSCAISEAALRMSCSASSEEKTAGVTVKDRELHRCSLSADPLSAHVQDDHHHHTRHRSIPDFGSSGAMACTEESEKGEKEEEVVHSAILLVLHEYFQSSRSVISLVDFVERVLAKLRRGTMGSSRADSKPVSYPPEKRKDREIHQLLSFLQVHYPGQTLVDVLRLVGCRFLLPSREVMEDTADTSSPPQERKDHASRPPTVAVKRDTSNGDESGDTLFKTDGSAFSSPVSSLSFRLASPSMDFRFTLPSILPSRLPPADFVQRLEREMCQ